MSRVSERRGTLVALALGLVALVGGTLVGWNEGWLDAVARPPILVRAALVGVTVVVGLMLLGRAATRIAGGAETLDAGRNLPGMIRGVRYAFLAVAAFAAAAGWLLAHPLPLVIALVIAAVDVLETSFLLLVVTLRGDGPDHGRRSSG